MFIAEVTEFLKAIVGDKPISCGIEEACKSLEMILTVQNKLSK